MTNNSANEPTGAVGTVMQGQGLGVANSLSTATYPATTTADQLLYSSATNTVSELANGTTGQVLTATTGAAPSWAAPVAGTDLHTAIFIVGDTGNGANYSTIATALTAASSGDTIYIQTGTYTEDLTLKAGVNLCAFECDAFSGNVTIVGKASFSAAGTVSISGIRLQTNSDFLLSVTGTVASIVNLTNCYLNVSNNTAIEFSSSSASANIMLYSCRGDLGTTGISYFSDSSAGVLNIEYSLLQNSGNSVTKSTKSAGSLYFKHTTFSSFLTYSSSSVGSSIFHCEFPAGSLNTTAITTSGTGLISIGLIRIFSGTASAISIGTGTTITINDCIISTSNTNAITGAGTLNYSALAFSNTSAKIDTTTQTGGTLKGGLTQAPSAGFLGEQIKSSATGVSLSNGVAKTIASISLTSGIWSISGVLEVNTSSNIATASTIGIGTTTNSFAGTTAGDTNSTSSFSSADGGASDHCLAGIVVVLTSTTTYYLVGRINSTTGTLTGSGRISAIRVG